MVWHLNLKFNRNGQQVGVVEQFRFQVLTTVSMEMAIFWDVEQCSLVDNERNSEELTASVFRVMSHCPTDGHKKLHKKIFERMMTGEKLYLLSVSLLSIITVLLGKF
jgi:hypothetical protein